MEIGDPERTYTIEPLEAARAVASSEGSTRERAGRAREGRGGVKAPDYVEPIIAWRAWLVVAEEGIRLSSVVYRNVWPPRCELEATCHRIVFAFPRIWQRKPPLS